MKFDMHCHTKEGSMDGKVMIEEYIAVLRKKGFGGMLVSDHNSYNGYRAWKQSNAAKKHKDFVVLKGIEYDTIDAGHILVIMPSCIEMKILELRGLPVQFLIDIVHRHGGILGPAHPCGERHLSILRTRKHKNQLAVMNQFDFVEGFNSCEEIANNNKAMEIAKRFKKPAFGGSDAHKLDCIGLAYTDFCVNIKNEDDLIEMVKEKGRDLCTCGGVKYEHTTKDKLGKANHILVESFWFYNHFASIVRGRRRKRELKGIYHKVKR